MRQLTAGAIALLAGSIALAACQPGATTAPTQAAVATNAATQAPVVTLPPLPSGIAVPSLVIPSFNQDEELEDLLPDTVGGATVTKISMTGDTLMGTGQGQEELQAVLTKFNKQPSDLSVAIGGAGAIGLFAYRIKGVDANEFFESFLAAARVEDPAVSVTEMNLGGKAVRKVVTVDETLYLYASGDVLFGVGGDTATEAQLAEALSLLP
jgi:hypothetical protein